MDQALDQFKSNIVRVRTLIGIHDALKQVATQALDISDILRSALVMAVSSLDYYIHEVVRLGMLETHRGERPPTEGFLKFDVSLRSVLSPKHDDDQWLEDEIRQRHSWQSFENPDRIVEAIHLVSEIRLWDSVAPILGQSPSDIRQKVNLIVDRRNKIAHEADIDPSYPGTRWPIDDKMVTDAVIFIENVVSGIHTVLTR